MLVTMNKQEQGMEWENTKESDNVALSCPQKSISSAACNIGALGGSGFTVRETQSFTGALEELKIDTTSSRKQQPRRLARTENGPMVVSSPFSCKGMERFNAGGGFRTREQDTMRLYITGPEILHYQGRCYSADDIAPIWKKDCRMWLWKAVCNARKRRRQLAMLN